MRRGIILAGGRGSRLFPLTKAVNKQLLPIYDKPLIYYPLSTLMTAGIRDILIIVGSEESRVLFEKLLGDGSEFNVKIQYAIQHEPRGLADAFLIGEEFIGDNDVVLALGDNIFYGQFFERQLKELSGLESKNIIFGYQVKNPEAYGVAAFGPDGRLNEVIEKPNFHVSNWAVPGLYFYDNSVVERAKDLKPSARGELEITGLHNSYIKENKMNFIKLDPGAAWFDTGTMDHLLEAGQFVKAIQSRTGILIGSPYRVAAANGW